MKIIYLTNARLPTEKAHGGLIVRMCEAFTRLGANVSLLHAWRSQPNPQLSTISVLDYYNVTHPFTVKTLPNINIQTVKKFLPRRVWNATYSAHTNVWGLLAAMVASKMQADLYVLFDGPPSAVWWLAKKGLPTVVELNQIPGPYSRRILKSAMSKPGLKLVTCITQHMANTLQTSIGISRQKILVTHNGVDLDFFRKQGETDKNTLCQPLNTDSKPTIVYAGQLTENRGVHTLVQAAALLPKVNIKIVGGEPNDIERLRLLAKEIKVDNISFVGHVLPNKVPEYLHSADALILPMSGENAHTSYHASPSKLFEYMATGVPIIASDLPSIREVLTNEESAILVRPDDSHALAAGINRVLSNKSLANRIGSQSETASRSYTWERRVKRVLEAATGSDKI